MTIIFSRNDILLFLFTLFDKLSAAKNNLKKYFFNERFKFKIDDIFI